MHKKEKILILVVVAVAFVGLSGIAILFGVTGERVGQSFFLTRTSYSNIQKLPVQTGCTDSDNGKIYEKAGYVLSNGERYNDYCSGDFSVREYYCSGESYGYIESLCSYSCESNRCLKSYEVTSCKKTAGNFNFYQKGIGVAPNALSGVMDQCLSTNKLREWYCEDNRMKYMDKVCNCNGGQCV